jgi:hypothetical protein
LLTELLSGVMEINILPVGRCLLYEKDPAWSLGVYVVSVLISKQSQIAVVFINSPVRKHIGIVFKRNSFEGHSIILEKKPIMHNSNLFMEIISRLSEKC